MAWPNIIFINYQICLTLPIFVWRKNWWFYVGHIFKSYRVANKFSDTLNELFVVNWLISKTFGENTKWELASSSHYLKILVKSINHGLSYSLKRDQKSISKITFVPGFVLSLLIQKLDNFSQKMLLVFQICIILAWIRFFG